MTDQPTLFTTVDTNVILTDAAPTFAHGLTRREMKDRLRALGRERGANAADVERIIKKDIGRGEPSYGAAEAHIAALPVPPRPLPILLPALSDTTRRAQAAYFRASLRRAERDRRVEARVRDIASGPVMALPATTALRLADMLNSVQCMDVMALLRALPDNSIDCCVSSPPYFGLRDYQTATWEGGDPACDHKTGRQTHRGLSEKQSSNHGSLAIQASDVCPRCGARRIDAQIGLEDTPAAFVARLVEVYREVRRVLKPSGVVFVNIGDSYCGYKGEQYGVNPENSNLQSNSKVPTAHMLGTPQTSGLKPKDRMLIPQRLILALQNDGWFVRDEIVWEKKNPMPQSVQDRTTTSHEMVYMLTKSPRYWFDQEAIREPAKPDSTARLLRAVSDTHKNIAIPGQKPHTIHQPRAHGEGYGRKQDDLGKRTYTGFNDRWAAREEPLTTRNARSVWALPSSDDINTPFYKFLLDKLGLDAMEQIVAEFLDAQHLPKSVWTFSTEPLSFQHYAAFPSELPRRCIKAGCPPMCCAVCGKPYERVVEASGGTIGKSWHKHEDDLGKGMSQYSGISGGFSNAKDSNGKPYTRTTRGWQPTCTCNAGTKPGIVLDMFAGSGTTLLVARELGRDWIGGDLSQTYVDLCRQRLRMPFEQHYIQKETKLDDLPLFQVGKS